MTKSTSNIKQFQVEEQKIIPYPPSFYQTTEEDKIELYEILRTIWHGKWLIIAFFIIGTLSSYAVTTVMQKTYSVTVKFLTEDEIALKNAINNPKILRELVHKENIAKLILSGFDFDNYNLSISELEDQAVRKLQETNVISFDKKDEMLFVPQVYSPGVTADERFFNKLTKQQNIGYFTVSLASPESSAKLANILPKLLNKYTSDLEVIQLEEKLISVKNKIVLLGNTHDVTIDKITQLSNLVNDSYYNNVEQSEFIKNIDERLAEKLSDMAIASTNLVQKKEYNRLKKEVKALEILKNKKQSEINSLKKYAIKLDKAMKNYEILLDEELKLIKAEQQITQVITNLKNRKIEMLYKASIPQFSNEPKTKFIVSVSAIVSLIVAIFLVFIFDFVRNSRKQKMENRAPIVPQT